MFVVCSLYRSPLQAKNYFMCNLKKLARPMQEVADLFEACNASGNAEPSEVYPRQIGVVITQSYKARTLEAMTWGIPLTTANMCERPAVKGVTPNPKPVNNARMTLHFRCLNIRPTRSAPIS